jgi:spermidine/putrescine transport system substrate-binding protein
MKNNATKIALKLAFTIATALSFSLPSQAGITLNMLTWEGYSPDDQVEKFKALVKEKHNENVHLNITYVSSADEFFTKIRNNTVDIIAPSHNVIKDERYKLISNNLLLPIDLNNIPNYSKLIPSLQKAEYSTIGEKVYSVPLVHGPYGLAYNTELVSPPPESWLELWNPKHAGRYTISSDYAEVNIYVTALSLGFSADQITDIKMLTQPQVKKSLIQLIKKSNNLWEGVDTADGFEKNSLGAAWGFSFPELAKRGQTWAMAEPKEGTTGWVDGHAISRTLADKPLHKRIAEEWINFTLSDEFQLQAIVRGIGSAPVNISIKDKLTKDEIASFHLDDPDYFKNNRILWPTLSKRKRNFFNQLWQDALTASGK